MSCPEKHQKAGACVRDDAHKWHRASDGTKWEGTQYEPPKVTPKEDSSGAAVAKPEESALGAEEPIVGGQQVSDIPPEVAEVLAKQQAAQVETPQVDQAVAPAGTVRAVYTGSSASKLAPSIEAEMKRRLAKGPVLDEVPKARPQDPPRQLCLTCGVTLVGFDASHSCDKGDILKLLKPKGLHEALPPKLRFSGRYRLCLWRDAEGDYHVAEELVDENGAIVAFNVLDGPESWAFMGSRVLDLVVDKFTP